jgi:aspartate/glutamate racemase
MTICAVTSFAKRAALPMNGLRSGSLIKGYGCLILGCAEVGMLLNQDNVSAPVFDTTLVHCKAALQPALQ